MNYTKAISREYMWLLALDARNFRSFKRCTAAFRNFNVIVGQNAAGKSGLISILEFLKYVATDGLENAVSMFGEMRYLRNINAEPTEPTMISIATYNPLLATDVFSLVQPSETAKAFPAVHRARINYSMTLAPRKSDAFDLVGETLRMRFYVDIRGIAPFAVASEAGAGEQFIDELTSNHRMSEILVSRDAKNQALKVDILTQPDDIELKPNSYLLAATEMFESSRLPLIDAASSLINLQLKRFLGSIPFYNLEPDYTRDAVPISGRTDLDENGENLALVLRTILRNEEERQRFEGLMRDALPFMKQLEVKNLPDMTRLVEFSEYYSKVPLPAAFVSDGTINVIAILVALFFQDRDLIIFEEPERHLHPALLSRIIALMYARSQTSQIIITSQSSSLLDNVDASDVLYVSREPSGASSVSRVTNMSLVKDGLENDLSLGDLHTLNFLGGNDNVTEPNG